VKNTELSSYQSLQNIFHTQYGFQLRFLRAVLKSISLLFNPNTLTVQIISSKGFLYNTEFIDFSEYIISLESNHFTLVNISKSFSIILAVMVSKSALEGFSAT
jgi:hypothetical protein